MSTWRELKIDTVVLDKTDHHQGKPVTDLLVLHPSKKRNLAGVAAGESSRNTLWGRQ